MSNVDTTSTPAGAHVGTAVPAKVKRPSVTERQWLKDGAEVKDPREADAVQIEVIGAGLVKAELASFSPGIQNALGLFGLNIVLTNTMGGERGDEAYESMMSRLETLQAGEWTSRKGAEGPRLSLLAHAIVAAFAKAGQEKDVETVTAALKEKGDEGRKAVLATPAIKAEYDRLKAEAAAKRAAASAEAAGSAQSDLSSLGL